MSDKYFRIGLLFLSLSFSAFSKPAILPVTDNWPAPYGKTSETYHSTDADSAHDFDVLHYYLNVFPYYSSSAMRGIAAVEFTPSIPNFSLLQLHAQNLSIQSIVDTNYDTLEYTYSAGLLTIDLGNAYQPMDTVEISIEYTATVVPNNSELGFHRWGNFTFTFAEPYGARKWFPCYDQPFDKAFSTIEITLPAAYFAASNGELVEEIHNPGYSYFRYQEINPISTYLISIACGPYAKITDISPSDIPLIYYVYPEDSSAAIFDFANTGDMMEFFSDAFGDYPFNSYGMAEAHIFNGWGAMEHQTMTTYGFHLIDSNRTYEYIDAHELAHMWWGDCLSPLTFADIWLNEGFASYSEVLYMDYKYGTIQQNLAGKANSYFWEDQNNLRYPIYNPPEEYLFGSAVYNKGAWVLHMLRNVIGDSAFFEGISNYLSLYSYSNVVTAEFHEQMENASVQDLGWFFDEWVYQAGYPEYQYSWGYIYGTDDSRIGVQITQTQSNAPVFSMPVEIEFSTGIADTIIIIWNDQVEQIYEINLGSFYPVSMQFDPGNKILKSADYVEAGWNSPELFYSFQLNPPYPNPFNNSISFSYTLACGANYSLEIYNIAGEIVSSLDLGWLEKGNYNTSFNADNLSSGIYYAVLKGRIDSGIQKIVLIK